VSGNGNLFKPGVFTGKPTQFRLLDKAEKGFATRHKDFAPSFGFAYSPSFKSGLLSKVFGQGDQTVLRGGYSIAYTREGFNAYTAMFGSNDGPTLTLDGTASIFPDKFLTTQGVLYRTRSFPTQPAPADTSRFPLTPGAFSGTGSNDFDPHLKAGYTQSWTFGLQRAIDKNTAVEVRYVGTHGTHLWRQMDYNEVNIFENGFLDQFKAAQNNMLIFARQPGSTCVVSGTAVISVSGTCNYGNSGLAGQVNVPLITTAIGGGTDSTTATLLAQGQAGALANSIAFSSSRMGNLINNGLAPFVTLPNGQKVSNFFIVNPQTTGGAFVMTNGINTTFNALQIELRRRLSSGLLVQGSYQYGEALSNSYSSSSSVFSDYRTLRLPGADVAASPWDLRHAFKIDWIYELPIGPGKPFLTSNNPVISRVVGGWQLGGVVRIQSGSSTLLNSGRATFNQKEAGVVLHNISRNQLQQLLKIRKTTNPVTGKGVVYWLPQSIIDNTLAAFELGGKTVKDLDPNAPYIGPPTTPGELGERIILYGPMTARFDLNVMKRIRVTERTSFEGRVQFLNAFNRANFYIGDQGSVNDPRHIVTVNDSQFGQTRVAYRDPTVSGTNDPGGRIVEFQLRFNF
jgi:hypothetical protein